MIFAISSQQIKSISIDFCEFYSESCEKCLKSNTNPYYESQCYWSNNKCKSEYKLATPIDYNLNYAHPLISQLNKCYLAKPVPTLTSKKTTTLKPNTTKSNSTLPLLLSTAKKTSSIISNPIMTHESLNKQILVNKTLINSDQRPLFSKTSQMLSHENLKTSTTNIYIIVSVIGSIIGLCIGLVAGYIIKANYSRKLVEFFLARSLQAKEPTGNSGSSQAWVMQNPNSNC